MLHAVRRRIAPAASPVHTDREIYGHLIFAHLCIRIITKALYRSGKNTAADGCEAGIHIFFLKAGQNIINSDFSAELFQLRLA